MTTTGAAGREGEELVRGALTLARLGLVTAFGHISARTGAGRAVISPPEPLGALARPDELVEFALRSDRLGEGLPGEAWIHWAIYNARPDVGAICRAQPPSADLAGALGVKIVPRHGQGAFLGDSVAVFDDARLVRNRDAGERLAVALASGNAVLMRGNGAVTTGQTVGQAVARMWVLERSAQLNTAALGVALATRLNADEIAAWQRVQDELLMRIWAYLRWTRSDGLS
jgi:HCOMODA/2-hydroxy-3-carboxy-muconic semialdehyde decarboxylase